MALSIWTTCNCPPSLCIDRPQKGLEHLSVWPPREKEPLFYVINTFLLFLLHPVWYSVPHHVSECSRQRIPISISSLPRNKVTVNDGTNWRRSQVRWGTIIGIAHPMLSRSRHTSFKVVYVSIKVVKRRASSSPTSYMITTIWCSKWKAFSSLL